MFILVTGANGQLGKSIKSLVNQQKTSDSFVFVTRDQLDLSSPSSIKNYFETHKFDLIINCAAYTAVDKAESYKKETDMINHIAVRQIAEIARSNNTKLIHISTDYVYDGLKNAKGIVTKTNVQKGYKAMDEDAENAKTLKSWLDANETIAATKKEIKALTAISDQSIQSKIKEDKTLEYIFELTIIKQ